MKKLIILIALSIILIGCKKESPENKIEGHWLMTEYTIENDNVLANAKYELDIKEDGSIDLTINDTNIFTDCFWAKTSSRLDLLFFKNSFYDKQIFDLEIIKLSETEMQLEGDSKRYDNLKKKTKIYLIRN